MSKAKIAFLIIIAALVYVFFQATNDFNIYRIDCPVLVPSVSDIPQGILVAVASAETIPEGETQAVMVIPRSSPPSKIAKFTITAYSTVPAQTDDTPCIAASGKNVCGRHDVVACPGRYKYGTKFRIKNKVYICEDRTSTKYGDRIDISYDKDMYGALEWGKQVLEVEILNI